MVKLTKIYTKTGDDGSTGLGSGGRVSKADPRVEAYGTVDEANAAIGLAVAEADRAGRRDLADVLRSLQQDLFDAGADLCVPIESGEKAGARLRLNAGQTSRLERIIDEHNSGLPALTSFILPGGSPLGAALHLARTVTRRAERLVVQLQAREGSTTNPETTRYLNRLSDLLFVLGRVANTDAGGDVLWVPGANRRP